MRLKIFRLKKIFFLVFCLFLLFPSFVLAQDWLNSPLEQSLKARKQAEKGEINMESYLQKTFRETAISTSIDILGLEYVEPTPGPEGKKEGFINLNQRGLLPKITNLIAAMYTHPPASFSYYAYDLLQNAGLAPKAYAQGIGFSGLAPLLPLWKTFRNIAYMLIVIVLIVIGFMIMFRMKINPQTVISIQNALPRIAVTLILITFSYAIVGLMIDLMYLGILLVISILGHGAGWDLKRIAAAQSHYTTGNLGTLFLAVFMGGYRALDDLFSGLFSTNLISSLLIAIVGGLTPLTTGIGGFFGGLLVPTGLFLLIFSLALLFIFIRLFVILLSSYIQIVLALIFGPLQILFDAFPGRSGFLSWLLGILGNLIVFPTTAALLVLASIFTAANIRPGGTIFGDPGRLWSPPLGWIPAGSATVAFIGLGILMLTPSLVGRVKKTFQPKPTIPLTPGVIFAPFGMAVQQTLATATQFHYAKEAISLLGGLKKKLLKEE